jgi:acyl phosphate:glycerol-3-phosphate acyltransferase
VIGHVFPLYLGFRGGKAVATGSGAIVGIDPLIFVIGGAVWMLSITTVRMVSVASIAMALTFPIVAWQRIAEGTYGTEVVWGTGALAALVVWRHRMNLLRIASGTEPRTGKRADAPGTRARSSGAKEPGS